MAGILTKCAARLTENTCDKPRSPTCCHGYQLPRPTMAAKFVQESAWGCDCVVCLWVGLSKRFYSTSCLREPTLCTQSCLLLDSEASAELGKAEISDDPECFGSPQAFTDDCETHSDCLIDSQCKPPSSDRPDTLALHCNPPSLSTHSDTDHNLLLKKRVFFAACAYAPLPHAFHVTKSSQLYAFDE